MARPVFPAASGAFAPPAGAFANPAAPPGQPPVSPTFPPATPPASPAPGDAAGQRFEPGKILAIVEGEPILEGDVIGLVNQMLEPHKDKMTEKQYQEQRQALTMRFLQDAINNKILFTKFVASFPADARDKVLPKAREQVNKIFDQDELPKLLERAKVDTPAELDAKYREFGYSLSKHRRKFLEKMLGGNVVMQNTPETPEVTHEEMLQYYREHAEQYDHKARARWEQLTVLFDKFPDREAAYRTLAAMGDAVVLGTPFPAVAKKGSQELRAKDGGFHDWTMKGSLASEEIDRRVFSMPLQRMSRIFEDRRGLHIIRVLEREEAGRKPFEQVQVEIRKKLANDKKNAAIEEFIQEARREAQVITFLDEQPPSQPRQASRR